ncbi:hypothetical protein HW115_05360 [Verrucomicrobiaceae bacterium N1E253]|uniref:Uncharacterized protein n=1 Tax=Oceaniferula marina TaxID=2748318 RepID=A0A851GC72_9BACT|nr:Sip1-related alpha-galactosidase [Oceaniferula marina]NWK55026.1 hypothetical protein [Oceaniferula marina]
MHGTFTIINSALVSLFLLGLSLTAGAATTLDLTTKQEGVSIYQSYTGTPDEHGVLEQIHLKLPAFKQAVYYRGQWWPYGGNRVYGELLSEKSKEGGLFAIIQLNKQDYLAVLPLCGDHAWAWLAPQQDELYLKLGTKGQASVTGNIPVVTWARAASPYDAAQRAWKQASETIQIRGNMKLRENKTYPEMFQYLGWCSWEHFRKNINEKKLVEAFHTLEANALPIRYMLVDDGHFARDTLLPNTAFPNGYKPLTDLRNDEGIKWVGMWHALLGNAGGMQKAKAPVPVDHLVSTPATKIAVPKPNAASISKFITHLTSISKRDDIDFIKVDFYGSLLPLYAGSKGGVPASFPADNHHALDNPSAGTALYARVFQKEIDKQFDGLLNCNWHIPHFIFNSGESNVGRCGPDYKVNSPRARDVIFTSFSSIAWLGHTAWGDHDMFHSSDKKAGRMMAISKALSGGPIYLSDHPKHLIPNKVWPLCYQDGQLIRPIAPGAPVPEDLFMNSQDQRMYRTMAPLANRSVAIAFYNLHSYDKSSKQVVLESVLSKDLYAAASAMIQPYPGPWAEPVGGLLYYDHQSKQATKLPESGTNIRIAGFGEHLVQLSPIQKGWSVIGRTDKHLSAATVNINTISQNQLSLTLHESGPFAIWLASGQPSAKGIEFKNKGNGLFLADLPVKAEKQTVVITKSR